MGFEEAHGMQGICLLYLDVVLYSDSLVLY